MDIDLQQRSVEFSQLFKAHNNLRPALLEKMPPMQISRVSNQNSEFNEENEELIMNGDDSGDNINNKIAPSDSVSSNIVTFSCIFHQQFFFKLTFANEFISIVSF